MSRLTSELDTSAAPIAITLGNAALRVFARVVGHTGIPALSPDPSNYGKPLEVRFAGRDVLWYPMHHPGQRKAEYRQVRDEWKRSLS